MTNATTLIMLLQSVLASAFAPAYPRHARLHPGAPRSVLQHLRLATDGDSDSAPPSGEGDLTLDLFAQEMARNAATVEVETAAFIAK